MTYTQFWALVRERRIDKVCGAVGGGGWGGWGWSRRWGGGAVWRGCGYGWPRRPFPLHFLTSCLSPPPLLLQARYSADRRSLYVTTTPGAPGGVRTEKVGLPFDPDLFDHMVEHGVYVEPPALNPIMPLLHALARLVFPIYFSFLLIKFAFRSVHACGRRRPAAGGVCLVWCGLGRRGLQFHL